MLLLQDLAVVVLLMLIPLLAPSESGSAGFSKIARALGLAAVNMAVPPSQAISMMEHAQNPNILVRAVLLH